MTDDRDDMLMIFTSVVSVVFGYTSFHVAKADIFDELPNGTIYVNLGNRKNDSCAEILFIVLFRKTEKLPLICRNGTVIYNQETFEEASEKCDLIDVQSLNVFYETNMSYTCPSENGRFWVHEFSYEVVAERSILIENREGERCREPCERCRHETANHSAIAVRFELLDIDDQPDLCSRSTEFPTTHHVTHHSTFLIPTLPKDSKSKYVWFGVAAAILISLLILVCIFCKVCSGTTRKAEVPYAEPSDIVRSVTSEYSTPYDARSSTSAIVSVKAKPKPKVKIMTSIGGSLKNPFKRFNSSKKTRKKDDNDSGYCEIDATFTIKKSSANTSNVTQSQIHCSNVSPYATVSLEE